MAQSTTGISACDASIWLDDAAGTPRDISGSSNVLTMNFEHEIGDYICFGGRWPNRLECGKDASFDFVITYTTTTNEAFDILKAWYFTRDPGARTLAIYLPDKNVGSDKFSCEALIEHWDTTGTAGSGDEVNVNMRLLPNGEVSHTTAAT